MVRGWNRVTQGEPTRKVQRKVERNQACNACTGERGNACTEERGNACTGERGSIRGSDSTVVHSARHQLRISTHWISLHLEYVKRMLIPRDG